VSESDDSGNIYCGSSYPNEWFSEGNTISLIFISDEKKSAKGFKIGFHSWDYCKLFLNLYAVYFNIYNCWWLLGDTWYLLIYLSRYLDQETAKWPFRSSSHVATCYYQSNHIGRGNPIKCLAQGHNKRTCRLIFTLYLLNAERQTGKLWIPTFKVFWFDSTRRLNRRSTGYEADSLTTRLRSGC